MARWEPFNAVGGAYSDDARPWSVQDTVNYLVVTAERGGTRSPAILRGVPGMSLFCATMDAAPVRGIYNAEGRLFAVTGNTLYQIGTDGAATSLGTIPGVGRCTFAHNQITGGNEVVIANGQSGYVWNTVTETLTQITDDGFPGFKSVDFADQYIIGAEPFGRHWFHSDLSDAQSYNTLDRYTAEKSPDRIQQVIATGSDVFVLGERTAQFFYNTGAGTGTWANRQGAEMDRGAASPYTACRIDNTVIWLGDDGSVYRLNGYTAQRISTHALEQAISRSTLSEAFAFTFEDRGHKCYLLTFPDGRTWCFDAATGEWTRRESYGLDRWRANCLTKWQGVWIAGDYTNGKLYQLDWAVQTEAGAPLERRRTFPVLHDDQNKLLIPGLELVFDTGEGENRPQEPAPVQKNTLAFAVAAAPYLPTLLVESGVSFVDAPRSGEPANNVTWGTWKMDYAPSGARLAIASDNAGISVYSVSNDAHTYLGRIPQTNVQGCRFSQDSAHIVGMGLSSASTTSFKIYKYDRVSGGTVLLDSGVLNEQVNDAQYSPDGEHLALALAGASKLLVYKRSGDAYTPLTLPDSGGAATASHLAYNGDHLLVSANDNTTRIYKRTGDSYAFLGTLPVGGTYVCPAASADQSTLVLYTDVYTRSGDSYSLTGSVTGTTGTLTCAAFLRDGRLVLSSISTGGTTAIAARSGSDYVVQSVAGLPATETNTFAVFPDAIDPQAVAPLTTTDRMVQARYSKDGGRKFSAWRNRSLGELGEFCKRVRLQALGQGLQWVFEFRVTSPVRADLIAASLKAEPSE